MDFDKLKLDLDDVPRVWKLINRTNRLEKYDDGRNLEYFYDNIEKGFFK